MKPVIMLAWYEVLASAVVGVHRRVASLKRYGTNKVGDPNFGWHTDIEGAAAEQAVAKYLGVYWDSSVNTFQAPDIGSNIQVRHTKHSDGCLVYRKADHKDEIYILVTGETPEFKICGWILGKDAKKDKYIRNPGGRWPSYFVPQDKLRPIELLKRNLISLMDGRN